MACELKTEAYIPIVKNLFKLDSEKYKNFDNVVEFIAKSAIKPENKKLAIYNIAHIYQNLNGLDSKMYEVGKAKDVVALNLDDTTQYIKNVETLYGLKHSTAPTEKNIKNALDKLAGKKLITQSDVTDFTNLVKQHTDSTRYDNLQEKSDVLQSYKDQLNELVSNLSVDEDFKNIIYKWIDGQFSKLEIKSNYIPLSKVADIVKIDNYLFTLSNGTMVEGFEENGVYYIADPNDGNKLLEIAEKDIKSKKLARPSDINWNTTGKHVFFNDFFSSGFTIDSVSPEEYSDLMDELNKMDSPQSQIRIHAVQLSTAGDDRVKRMKELAFEDEAYSELKNRNHETFETVSQQELLKSKSDAKVVTVSRPKRSENNFALVGEIIGTGRKFYIYSVDNFAFVDANNNTQLVDLDNDVHVKELQSLSVKQVGNDQIALEEADMNYIKSSHKLYQEFKNEVEGLLGDALSNGENSTDVTTEFLNKYNISSNRATPTESILLSKVIDNPQFSQKLTIVTLDKDNNVISENDLNLPFVYYKSIDKERKKINYYIDSYLSKNQRIKYTTPQGQIRYLSQEIYAESVLQLKSQIEKMFEVEDKKLNDAMQAGRSVYRLPKTGRFVIKFMPDSKVSYAIANSRNQLEAQEFFANFAVTLSELSNEEGITNAMNNLEKMFQFGQLKKNLSFKFYSAVSRKNPQIEVRGYSKSDKYKDVITRDKNKFFNFEFSGEEVQKIANQFYNDALINQIIAENPSLKYYDLKVQADRVKFFNVVLELNNASASPAIKKFADNLTKAQKELTDYFINVVDKKLNAPELADEYAEFKELAKSDVDSDVVSGESLLTTKDENGNLVLNIKSPSDSVERLTFNQSFKNVAIVTNKSRKKFNITPKTTPTKEEATPVALTPKEIEIVNEVKEEQNKPDTTGFESSKPMPTAEDIEKGIDEYDTDDEDADEFLPFQLLADGITIGTNEDVEQASAWLDKALPQLGIDRSALKDIIDLSKIDGVVLGMYKDRMIYLNDALTSKGIVYHEAFHGVFRNLMSQTERDFLVKAIMDDPAHSSKFTSDAVYAFGKARNYTENNYDALARLVAEEILADGFQSYMLKKNPTEPKTMLQKFFDMLKKLLNFFVKNKNIIENTYGKIANGGYKSAVYNSNMYEGKAAFELIPVQTVQYKDVNGKKIFAKNVELNTYEQTQLINFINSQILSDTTEGQSFDQKFDRAVDNILENVFSIDKLVAQDPSKKNQILSSEWEKLYSKYRFVLGARMKGLSVFDINYTGDAENDKRKTVIKVQTSEGVVDNSKGEYSHELLRKLTKKAYNAANTLNIIKDQELDVPDADEIEKVISGESVEEFTDEDSVSSQDELGSNDFDEALGQKNPIDSYVRQVRRYFATIRNDIYDEKLGIYIPRVIDGNELFTAMLKISSNINSGNIIQNLGMMSDKMIGDGYVKEGSDIKAVYDDIVRNTGFDKSIGRPTKNHQLFNIITDALHGVELNYLFFRHTMPEAITEKMNEQQVAEIENQKLSFTLVDKVADTDSSFKRDKIIIDFVKSFKENASKLEYKDAIDKIITTVDKLGMTEFLNDIKSQSVMLRYYTYILNNAFTTIGFKVPKSLIELSLASIYTEEKGHYNNLDDKDKLFLTLNKNFINQGQYLQLDFFKSFKEILRSAYTDAGIPNRAFTKRLDDTTKNVDDKRFLLILKKASTYISKYDPTSLPSVIKNAEGKSIYRYAKTNPFATLAQRLTTMTLDEAISNDPYYERVRDYLNDNPFLAPLLNDPTSKEAQIARLYLDNFNVAMFGGVQQQVGKMIKDGKTFKGIDKRSLYLLQVLSFMNRRKVSDKYDNELSIYYRTFHQNEATQTNFMVPAIYTPFVDAKGYVKENGFKKITDTLVNVIKQEYNRIQREWATREDRKLKYDAGDANNNILKYNAILNSDGTANTDNNDLRAYNFNVLSDFFADPKNKSIEESLISFAKSGKKFETIDVSDLKNYLQEFAETEFAVFKQDLINEKLIKLELIPVNQLNTSDKRPTAVKTYYTSSLFPKTIKTDISKNAIQEVNTVYPTLPGFDSSKVNNNVIPLDYLLYDYFMNHWKNALETNQLMDGDIAMNVKNFQDYVKRLKKGVASGSNFKEGFHTTAVMDTITAFVHEDMPFYGPYYTKEQIVDDFTIPNETIRKELLEGYEKAIGKTKEEINGKVVKWGDMMREVFDGQSISTLMHQIDMHDSLGRVDDKIIDILIAKNYRTLTEDEIRYMESKKVVNNAKKTVTAGRNTYNKDSEDYIDRMDVSRLIIEPQGEETIEEATNRVFDELHAAYAEVYNLRRDSHYASLQDINHPDIANNKTAIQKIFKDKIHQYYEPLEHRKTLHNILNSMEFHQIDQLLDTTASKNATKLPTNIFNSNMTDENGYIRFDLSSSRVPNEDKYLQVETSGVKEKAKHSVQSKLLLGADLSTETFKQIVEKENAKRGTVMTASEKEAMAKITDELKNYHVSLGKAASSRLKYFQTILRDGKDFEVGKIFKMIRKSLEEQNAPSNTLKYFDLKPDGTPVFSPNLSIIRTTLEYYLISQYSNNVTDEKTAGGKNFHVSSFGNDVLVDIETNKVITTEEVSKERDKYSDKTRYKSRPLSITTEIQPDGSKLYLAEVIVPKPLFDNKQQEQFYMDNITKMFGVRIPTEDKRSMLAFKVVDFMDSSKLNNIIVPQFVHMLSGSDFDIDSLYMRMKSYYKTAKKNYVLFGDYSQYKNEDAGKFVEFIHFMSKHDDFAVAIKAEKQRLIGENTFELSDESPVFEVLDALGYNLSTDVQEFFDRKETKSKLAEEKKFTSYMFELAKDAKEVYVQSKLESELNPVDKELAKTRNQYGYEYAVIKNVKQKSLLEKRALQNRMSIIDAAYEYQAALNVFSEFGLPASIEKFKSDERYNDLVSMKYQNDNLDASLRILGNEAVFNYLYINQRSSVEQFRDILENSFGLALENLTQKGNLYTPTNMVLSKVENGSSKDGLGRTAVMNKFLSLCSQYNLELNEKSIIWKFINDADQLKEYKTFGQLNEEGDRVISLIGNILGMFADAAKDPIPAALQLNEVNVSTTLAMLGVGLKPEFAFGFNFLPGIRNASRTVQQAQLAISEDSFQDYIFYNNAVNDEIKTLLKAEKTLHSDLQNLGVFDSTSKDYKVVINKSNVKIEFNPQKLNAKKLENLLPSQVGFKVTTKNGTQLTDTQAEVVLMAYYWEQSQQAWSINRVANMTNLFKRLNPSLAAFDRQRDGISRIKDAELFTKQSVDRLFDGQNSIWKVMSETLDDANEQFSKILLERTPFFSGVTAQFAKYFKEPKMFANVITSYLGLARFVKTYPGSRIVENDYAQNNIDQDDAALLETFTPEYWFTNSLAKELEKMQELYPKNDFLKLLKPEESKTSAMVEYDGKLYPDVKERFLQIMSRAKIKGEFADKIVNNISELYNVGKPEERLFIKKLFYHELVRTGTLPKAGSFLQFMPADLMLPISDNIQSFVAYMKNATLEEKANFKNYIKEYLGATSEEDVYKFFGELFNQIAYAASMEKGNDRIPNYKYFGSSTEYNVSVRGTSKDNFSGTNYQLFNFLPEGSKASPTKEQMKDAVEALTKHVFNMFGATPDPSTNLREITKIDIAGLAGDGFTMNLTGEVSSPSNSISKSFGVKYNKDLGMFEFPALLRINKKVYVLQSTDSLKKGMSSGEALVKSFTGESIFTNFGLSASYKAVPEVYSSEKFSPLAFNSEQAEKYKSYTDRKATIKMSKKVEPIVKPTEVKEAPKNQSMSESDYTPASDQFLDDSYFGNFDWMKDDNDSEDPLKC